MFNTKLLKNEVFLIPCNSQTLVYTPLTRYLALYDGKIDISDVDNNWLQEAISLENIPSFVGEKGFKLSSKKLKLRLNITSGCNLYCSYCSVNAGSKPKNMEINVAKRVVDFFATYALENGYEGVEVVFSGGEPTRRISFILDLMNYVENHPHKRIFSFRLITNGSFRQNKKNLELLQRMSEVQVSWDGFLEVNPRFGSNKNVERKVWNNIKALVLLKIPVSVLVVISENNYGCIRKTVDQLYEIGIRHIFLSLQDTLGRAAHSSLCIDSGLLSREYFELWKDYRRKGIDINLGGTDIHSVSPYPCSVPLPNFSIAPNGGISSCTIAFNESTGLSESFLIGNASGDSVVLNRRKIVSLKKFNVFNLKSCQSCFAKWHCRGGCIFSKQGRWFDPLGSVHCKLLRDVVLKKLLYVLSEKNEA